MSTATMEAPLVITEELYQPNSDLEYVLSQYFNGENGRAKMDSSNVAEFLEVAENIRREVFRMDKEIGLNKKIDSSPVGEVEIDKWMNDFIYRVLGAYGYRNLNEFRQGVVMRTNSSCFPYDYQSQESINISKVGFTIEDIITAS